MKGGVAGKNREYICIDGVWLILNFIQKKIRFQIKEYGAGTADLD